MITQSIQIPRWRAVVLCLAGVLAMIKPLQTGIGIYRETNPPPVQNYSTLHGWVEPAGPFNNNELSRGESRLRLLAYPRESFTRAEIDQAAAHVRNAAWADIRRQQAERQQRAQSAWTDRAVGVTMSAIGAGGMAFYVWLGYALIRESNPHGADPNCGWFGKKKRHGRITFGAACAGESA